MSNWRVDTPYDREEQSEILQISSFHTEPFVNSGLIFFLDENEAFVKAKYV